MRQKLLSIVVVLLVLGGLAAGILLLFGPGEPIEAPFGRPLARGPLAVVNIQGPLESGWDGPFFYRGATAICAELRALQKDESVKGILLRINSPGGTVGSAQALYDEVERLRQGDKKVVAWVEDLGASGGYYVACAADEIVSLPGSLVGSVGVLMMLPDLQGLFEEHLKIKWRVIKHGAYKDAGSPFRKMTPEEQKQIQALVDDAYDQFFQAVLARRREAVERKLATGEAEKPASDRKALSARAEEELKRLCQGQIFIGREAEKRGLVDRLGSLEDARIALARLAGLPEDTPLPERRTGLLGLLQDLVRSRREAPLMTEARNLLVGPRLEYMYRPGL